MPQEKGGFRVEQAEEGQAWNRLHGNHVMTEGRASAAVRNVRRAEWARLSSTQATACNFLRSPSLAVHQEHRRGERQKRYCHECYVTRRQGDQEERALVTTMAHGSLETLQGKLLQDSESEQITWTKL